MAKILIVDDSPDLLDFMSILLKTNRHAVKTASSKKDLYAILDTFTPDIFLLDIMLNGEDGRDICKEIKATHIYKEIPIILLSANYALLTSFADCNADAIMEKPFDIKRLLNKINKLLINT